MDTTVQRLAESSKESKQEIEIMLSGDLSDKDFLGVHIQKYIKARLGLEEIPDFDLPLNQAIGMSVAKILDIDLSLLTEVDVPAGCTHANAVMSRRILLFMSLQDELNFKFAIEQTPHIRTVGDLVEQIWLAIKR